MKLFPVNYKPLDIIGNKTWIKVYLLITEKIKYSYEDTQIQLNDPYDMHDKKLF